jgi:4-aminobutyrate aminotransferase-like enzyme
MSNLPATNAEWIELASRYTLRHPMKTHASLVPERGEGIYMWDVEGNRYMDFMAGQLCVSLGHAHPEYTRAICEQAAKMVQAGTTFTVPSEILLAKKIAELAPDPLQRTLFACTGSESNEMALRLAKKATGRYETVCVAQNYHGSTMGSASAGGMGGFLREGYGPFLAGVCVVPLPYYYRLPMCRDGASEPEADDMLLALTEELIDAATTGRPAAFILEPLMAGAGMLVPSDKWMRGIRRLCRERGIMMIIDEALTGFGRTGRWFCFEHFGIVPDIVTTSKGLGGGVPICGITTSDEVAQRALDNGFMHFSSHSGDPLLCAAALKNLEIIERDGLVQHVHEVGGYCLRELERMQREYEIIGDARGLGLVLGLETVTDKASREPNQQAAYDIALYCFEHGLWLTNIRLQRSPEEARASHRYFPMNIVRLMPPMTVTREQAEEALGILEDGIRYAQERTARPASVAVGG